MTNAEMLCTHAGMTLTYKVTCDLWHFPGWSLAWTNPWIQTVSMKSSNSYPHNYQVSSSVKSDWSNQSCSWCLLILSLQAICSSLPAKHYDADTTEPISCALQTLEQLLSWKVGEANPFNVAVVPLAAREPPLASCPRRTVVSHDMMGGYLDDRYGCILGLNNPMMKS